mgnify:CR=1 FL=1
MPWCYEILILKTQLREYSPRNKAQLLLFVLSLIFSDLLLHSLGLFDITFQVEVALSFPLLQLSREVKINVGKCLS